MITSLAEVLKAAKARGPKTLVMPSAHEEAALEACVLAKKERLAESILLGEKVKITEGLKKVEEIPRILRSSRNRTRTRPRSGPWP